MYTVLSITIPFFAIIFLGTFFSYKKFFDSENAKTLTKFALFVTLPPFMFMNIFKSSSGIDIFNWSFIIRYEIVTLFLLSVSFFISIFILKYNKKESSIFALNSAYPNYGYMGIPLCILAFGETASIPISLILLFDSLLLFTFTSYFTIKNTRKNIFFEFFSILIIMLKNPILLAVFTGFIFVIFELTIPSILYKFLNILSLAATPTALFAIGITLYNKLDKNYFIPISIISFFKLFFHPILIFCVFYFSSEVPILWIKVAILCSCLPIAGNVFAMSIYYNSLIKITASSTVLTTILSTFSVPIILFLLL